MMGTMPGTEAANLDDLISLPMQRAAALAKVTMRQLYYWDFRHVVRPGIRQRVNLRTTVKLYQFNDLVELLVAATLRGRGFSLQRIRRVIGHLRSRGYEQPLRQLTFASAGGEIYFQHPDGSWEGDLEPDQLILREVIDLDMIREVIRQGARRPDDASGLITTRRGTRTSKPVFAGTRIPVEIVRRRLDMGQTTEEILDAYPDLTPADVDAARVYVAGA